MHIDKEQLLEEARLWGALEKVNWSELGPKYGVKGANRGENIKEFLTGYEIEATKQQQRKYRTPRRAKKRVQGSRLTVPMPPPATTERKKLTEREESGEFTLGDEVVEQEYTHFYVTPQAEIAATQSKISARRITLVDIRKKLLRKQCSMQTFEAI